MLGYPLDLSEPVYHKLAVHILNEGSIVKEKSRISTYSVVYYNKDPKLHDIVRNLGGKPSSKDERYDVDVTRIKRVFISPLIKLGIPVGPKVKNIPTYELSYLDEKAYLYYLRAVLTEEGHLGIKLQRGKYFSLRLQWTRFRDITPFVDDPKKIIPKLGYGDFTSKVVKMKAPELIPYIL